MTFIRTLTLVMLSASASVIAGPTADLTPAERLNATWAIWHDADGPGPEPGFVFRRRMRWPDAAGAYVDLPCDRAECYVWLRVDRGRSQRIAYPCREVADVGTETLTTTCTAEVRSPQDLKRAVANVAAERKSLALAAYEIESPTDQTRAIALLLAERRGETLAAQQGAWLDGFGALGVDYLNYADLIDARLAKIEDWIDANPGQIPAISDAEWPPLPTAEE